METNESNKKVEKKETRRMHELVGCKADLYCEETRMNGRPMKGRATYIAEGNKFSFVQYVSSGKKTRPKLHTDHGILSLRPDGSWYLSMRFTGGERLLKENLMVEMRDMVKYVEVFRKRRNA